MLNDNDRAILDFETANQHWKYAGARDAAILDTFGMTAPRYAQVVGRLLDDPAALAYAPTTVNRLRRLRDQRRHVRTPRT